MKTPGAPSDGKYSPFRCEEGVVVDVDRSTYSIKVQTKHSARDVPDIQTLAAYHHYENGEGIHHLPEVGAICLLGFPNDNTPPFIMGYLGAPAATTSPDGEPVGSTPDGQGSMTGASWRSKRPELNPGDIAITTRDENFLFLRRGGVVQIGATPIAQRIYIPILNFIKDFCENYEFNSFGGDVAWTVGRQEDDPSGNAPASYTFHMNEFAQDRKATVRVRHLPLSTPGGGSKSAWEIHVSPQGIDKDTGEVTSAVYSMVIQLDGTKTEIVGANRSTTVRGDDRLEVQGAQSTTVTGASTLTARSLSMRASEGAVLGGSTVKIGGPDAGSPAVKGEKLLEWFQSAQWTGSSGPYTLSPESRAALAQILSEVVFVK